VLQAALDMKLKLYTVTVTDFKIFSGFSGSISFTPSLSDPFLIQNSSQIPKRE
jgi:hypothetical protein